MHLLNKAIDKSRLCPSAQFAVIVYDDKVKQRGGLAAPGKYVGYL